MSFKDRLERVSPWSTDPGHAIEQPRKDQRGSFSQNLQTQLGPALQEKS